MSNASQISEVERQRALFYGQQGMVMSATIRIDRTPGKWIVAYDPKYPPHIYFDTNVWIGMSEEDVTSLRNVQEKFGFVYCYSVTNFIELCSHLKDNPAVSNSNPFTIYRSCFRKIIDLCSPQILPSPEMEFMSEAGLDKYIDSAWVPNIDQIAFAVELIANAKNPDELAAINPSHYRILRDIDARSMQTIMKGLQKFSRPLNSEDVDNGLYHWFIELADFFLLRRPSNEKININRLTKEEQTRFVTTLSEDGGRMFQTHCISLVKKTINDGRNIDPNDLYDMLQLILLCGKNRLFVSDEKAFFHYEVADAPELQRVLYWGQFR